ncbi:thiamine pyrophosphate-binding protein [bacterium M00.F.Ca.ET.228.01.1.1]|uniref:thiamine pyrophosphate-binding protein n=1 Tax=Paraburkholderia phenoliruptrix TaxID=252970 RepID=UPI00109286C8|nr:thiamine pyrophosphate-binding protein [Paraburkholderia phenoliruptrix]TGP47546.1 thiamine pyrophosphate-binding protein [bacterium M00.F.Ca.ET.228.01.1.1]TGS05339.1 thiamine pyrophosphate-binding protein [bacterium M00.F.Ca.ET.191.01.1.1]TGU10275.1 thiamine pyrophosphate-binding protein [bacterium M00.F.Ca.ET.155.01.1.1]MBW0445672.1 thiamine pyrophosphate-binding protein [Paraburkholderia phenoliruptrix]MBW9096437.1 thiamine pyrophosphate-binding protein [Paraburkholderia phenoliruptrix]
MSNQTTVGELIAAFLEQCGVKTAFGVISIHNMPILDAIHKRGKIRYVGARGEAGAVNMADGLARVSGGLGVAFTSTGTAAGNAAGAMVEALTAGTALLHVTGQIETEYLDKDLAYIHEAPDQLSMLQSISKAAYRVRSVETALPTIREAVRVAQTAPSGPVSVEIPIDIQAAAIEWPADLAAPHIGTLTHSAQRVADLAGQLAKAKRPLLWLGGGARHATHAVERLVALGFGVVTSVQGRGVLPEDHPASLGAFNVHAAVESFYKTCDALVVVGSRLRGNETLKYKLALPQPLYRIDADALADNRGYRNEMFVHGDAKAVLEELATLLEGRLKVDPAFAQDLAAARESAVADVGKGLGPYKRLVDALQAAVGRDYNWVRDVTISNSTWGNRMLKIFSPRAGVHALGGGIGQGMQMGIGAALAGSAAKTVCLVGDGGLMVNVGELATAVQENANVMIVLMNDQCYGVIRNIQDAQYGGRRCYVDLHQPDFAQFCESLKLTHYRIKSLDQADAIIREGMARTGPVLVEVDMLSVGSFATAFAGPPVKEEEPEHA